MARVRTPARELAWIAWARGLLEFLVGALTVSLLSGTSTWSQMLVATAVVAGRQYPVFRDAVGVKAFMVALGAMFSINPVTLPLWALLWAVGFVTSGFRTAGLAAATVALPLALGIVGGWPFAGMALPVCALLFERQREDVRRMFLGAEPKHYWK